LTLRLFGPGKNTNLLNAIGLGPYRLLTATVQCMLCWFNFGVQNDERKWNVTLSRLILEDTITKTRNENKITCKERKG